MTKIINHTWIPLSDGVRLSAKIWLPENAEKNPCPTIFEYIPYRKRDFKAMRDAETFDRFAKNGYAGIRVDIRGSGDSEGILRDEYLKQELDDGLEILKWIAAQPWSNGDVGMMGISWGGFNSLQLAALNPPELKAIICVAFSDHRYSDDVHYMGGNMLTDNLSWASTMFAYNSCPPDPEIVGDKFEEMWLERLEGSGLWLKKWLEHQTLDEYWKHASIGYNYDAIKCPVYAFGGWADGYTNPVFRLMKHLNCPKKAVIGSWGHKYPHMGGPGPSIDFLGECVLWWDKWMKGTDNGIDKESRMQVWMQDTPSPVSLKRPGKWIFENEYPTRSVHFKPYALKNNEIDPYDNLPDYDKPFDIQSPLSVGLFAGKWCSFSASTELPYDQREEDGGALIFQTPTLKESTEVFGAPEIELTLSSDKPQAMVAARISDVALSGRASRVTYGVLNLTHRDSDEKPEYLEPGKKYTVRMKLNYMAQHFPKGNQIRLSLSTSYWPLVWPSPEQAKLTVYPDESKIWLPFRENPQDLPAKDLGKPDQVEPLNTTTVKPAEREWKVIHDMAYNEVSLNVKNQDTQIKFNDINWQTRKEAKEKYSYKSFNYDTLRGKIESVRGFYRDDWSTEARTKTVLTSTKTHFVIRATIDAYLGDVRIFSISWDEKIKRNYL